MPQSDTSTPLCRRCQLIILRGTNSTRSIRRSVTTATPGMPGANCGGFSRASRTRCLSWSLTMRRWAGEAKHVKFSRRRSEELSRERPAPSRLERPAPIQEVSIRCYITRSVTCLSRTVIKIVHEHNTRWARREIQLWSFHIALKRSKFFGTPLPIPLTVAPPITLVMSWRPKIEMRRPLRRGTTQSIGNLQTSSRDAI